MIAKKLDLYATRRGFLTGLGATLIAAPAIVRAGSLMPTKSKLAQSIEVAVSAQLADNFCVGDLVLQHGHIIGVVTSVISAAEIDVAIADHGPHVRLTTGVEPYLQSLRTHVRVLR